MGFSWGESVVCAVDRGAIAFVLSVCAVDRG